jgi:hypothetical protein
VSDYEIVVVTKVPDAEAGSAGNMAMAGFNLYWSSDDRLNENDKDEYGLPKVRPFVEALKEMLDDADGSKALGFILCLRQPVFNVGEILILDAGGREVGYPGRKPRKWSVETEAVETLAEAAALSHRVMYPEYEEESK